MIAALAGLGPRYRWRVGLTVNLGLRRYCDDDKPARVVAMLEALVCAGASKLLREVLVEEDDYGSARVVEVTPAGTRWLPDAEAIPIRAGLEKTRALGLYDAYSWDRLEEIGAYNIQDLALPLDGGTQFGLDRIDLGDELELRVIDLADSELNWPKRSIAYKLHQLAKKYRMIVASA